MGHPPILYSIYTPDGFLSNAFPNPKSPKVLEKKCARRRETRNIALYYLEKTSSLFVRKEDESIRLLGIHSASIMFVLLENEGSCSEMSIFLFVS